MKRGDNRGRPRSVLFKPFPHDTPIGELANVANGWNRGEMDERYSMGFVLAKDYRKE